MGLDATAFKVAELTEPHDEGEDCWEDDHVRAFIIDDSFHRSARGLTLNRCYRVDGRQITVSNSYGGHSRFREELARVFYGVEPSTIWHAPDDFADRPFFELIHFADNEGTIGPEAAADLAADFEAGRAEWLADARIAAEVSDWTRRKYDDEWAEAFVAAANGGLVTFR